MMKYNFVIGKIYFSTLLWMLCFGANGFYKIDSLVLGNVSDDKLVLKDSSVEMNIEYYSKNQSLSSELKASCLKRSRPKIFSIDKRRKDMMNFIANIQYGTLNSLIRNIVFLS